MSSSAADKETTFKPSKHMTKQTLPFKAFKFTKNFLYENFHLIDCVFRLHLNIHCHKKSKEEEDAARKSHQFAG